MEKGRIQGPSLLNYVAPTPAKICGIFLQKGTIAAGSDADIVIFDPEYRGVFSNENSLHRVDFTPYEGMEQRGRAEKVFLRGELVAENGQYLGTPGSGQFVPGKAY